MLLILFVFLAVFCSRFPPTIRWPQYLCKFRSKYLFQLVQVVSFFMSAIIYQMAYTPRTSAYNELIMTHICISRSDLAIPEVPQPNIYIYIEQNDKRPTISFYGNIQIMSSRIFTGE